MRHLPPGAHADAYRRDELNLALADGAVLQGWVAVPNAGSTEIAERALLYLGGRNENVGWAPDIASYSPSWHVYAFMHSCIQGAIQSDVYLRRQSESRGPSRNSTPHWRD